MAANDCLQPRKMEPGQGTCSPRPKPNFQHNTTQNCDGDFFTEVQSHPAGVHTYTLISSLKPFAQPWGAPQNEAGATHVTCNMVTVSLCPVPKTPVLVLQFEKGSKAGEVTLSPPLCFLPHSRSFADPSGNKIQFIATSHSPKPFPTELLLLRVLPDTIKTQTIGF